MYPVPDADSGGVVIGAVELPTMYVDTPVSERRPPVSLAWVVPDGVEVGAGDVTGLGTVPDGWVEGVDPDDWSMEA